MLGGCGWLIAVAPAQGQTVLDRADPASHASPRPAEPAPSAPIPHVDVERPAPAVSAAGAVMVGAVRFAGLQALDPADFAELAEPYLGRSVSPGELADLAGKVADRARARGYLFASASIGTQRLSAGVLTVTVDEGRIDEVRLDGPDQPAVRAALAPLTRGRPVTLAEVERRLLIAGDIDGVWVRSTRFVREGGRGVLVVRLGGAPIAGRVAITNDGTRPLGPEEIYARIDARQVLFADDALTASYAGALAEPGEHQSGRVSYGKRVSADGLELAIDGGVSRARPGAYLKPLDIVARSWTAGLSALRPIARRRAASLWLSGDLDVRDARQFRAGRPVRDDRLTVARLGLRGFSQVAGGRLRAGATLSRGLNLFDATELGDALASRRDADGVFTSLDAWAEWTGPIAGPLSLRAGIETQVADAPLLVSEEVGLGGTAYLRGYDWSERSGDQGTMGAVELRLDWVKPLGLIRRAQFYGFVDGGRVTNLRGGFGGGGLASAGGGVRADVTRALDATVEIAAPLSGPRYETGDRRPRINLGVSHSF